jgi:hypothetical protein
MPRSNLDLHLRSVETVPCLVDQRRIACPVHLTNALLHEASGARGHEFQDRITDDLLHGMGADKMGSREIGEDDNLAVMNDQCVGT